MLIGTLVQLDFMTQHLLHFVTTLQHSETEGAFRKV